MLAVVHHDQCFALRQLGAQRLDDWLSRHLAQPENLGHRAWHQCRIGQHSQVHQPDTVAVRADHLGGDLKRKPGLADAADADQGQQACPRQQALDLNQFALAANERCQLLGKI